MNCNLTKTNVDLLSEINIWLLVYSMEPDMKSFYACRLEREGKALKVA